MRRQTPARRAADTMLAVQLDVQRVVDVAAGTDSDPDAVVERRMVRRVRRVGRRLVLRLVQLETDLREVVELGNGAAVDLGLDAALEDAVQQRVDVRLLGEVEERLGVVRRLHLFEVLDNLLEQRKRCEEPDFKLCIALVS